MNNSKIGGMRMYNCWQCKYYHTSKDKEPCRGCNKYSNFKLWLIKEEK